MTGTCICGAVCISIEAAPEYINDCNCGLCRKSGAAWSYFGTGQVVVTGETISYLRGDKDNPFACVHSCTTCGATTHFTLSEAFQDENPTVDMIGVNMRLFEADALQGVEVRFPNGRDWGGEGAFDYRREAHTIGPGWVW